MLQNIPQKMLILIVALVLFLGFVCSNRASAWTVRLYAEGNDLGETSVTIGVASEAKSIPAPPTAQDSVILKLYSSEGKPLSVDIREEGNTQYTWIILVNPYGDDVPLDTNRTATLRWDFCSLFKAGTFELRQGTDAKGQIAVADMIITKSYFVDAIRLLAVIFTDAENNEGDIETENDEDVVPAIPQFIDDSDSGGGGCFIVSCHSRK